MTYTIEEIKDKVTPIAQKYGVKRISLFGSYARGEATENSDLDFIIDDGEINGLLKYISLVRKLEETFHCHVDLISSGSSNKKFLKSIKNEEILIYEK